MRGISQKITEMICLKKLSDRLLTELMNWMIKRSGNYSTGSDRLSGKDNTPSRPISRSRQPSGGTASWDGTSGQENG